MTRPTARVSPPATPRVATPPARRRAAAFRGGFNLIEVMVSMGIFVIAFVAVASIFPTAITLQREATQTVDDRAAEASAEAVASTVVISLGDFESDARNNDDGDAGVLGTTGDLGNYRLQPLLDDIHSTPSDMEYAVRSFGANPTATLSELDRRYVWIPMIQPTVENPTGTGDWRVLVVLLRRDLADGNSNFSDPGTPKSFMDDWASEDDWSSASADQDKDSGPAIPGLRWLSVSGTPSYNASTNRTTFSLGTNGNRDDGGSGDNRLIIESDTFLGDDGVDYTVIESDFDTVTVSGVVPDNPDGNQPARIWYAPRPLADGTTDIRPDDAPSPFVAVFEAGVTIAP